MTTLRNPLTRRDHVIKDPPFLQWLFTNPWASLLWLPLRLWIGYEWLSAGWGKLHESAWMDTGYALRGFWQNAVQVSESGHSPIGFDWYRDFIQYLLDHEAYTWFAKVISISEFTFGLLLMLGAFTGLVALFSSFMTWNFIMAGSASTNGVMFLIAIGLILAWKVAGYIGLDYFLLPALGTPWDDRHDRGEPAPGTRHSDVMHDS